MATITYPPEMLPTPDEGDDPEVILVEERDGVTVWHWIIPPKLNPDFLPPHFGPKR